MGGSSVGQHVREYIERVVNRRDPTAVDDLVCPDYRGSGPDWPTTLDALRQFYADQYRERPDWHIDVLESGLEVIGFPLSPCTVRSRQFVVRAWMGSLRTV